MIRYIPKASVVSALNTWSGKLRTALPADAPPCGRIPDADGENGILAEVFGRLCCKPTMTDRLAYLTATIMVHERRIEMSVEAFRGRADVSTPFTASDRELATRSRPYQAMINAMKAWLDELVEASGQISAGFIDQAARAAS